jgi:hypothetical protein
MTVTATLTLGASAAAEGLPGVRLDLMPVGCRIRAACSTGGREMGNVPAPPSCFGRTGRCTCAYRNGDGIALTFQGNLREKGGMLTISGGFDGQPPCPAIMVEPGPFIMGDHRSDGSTTFRVTRYEGCGVTEPTS